MKELTQAVIVLDKQPATVTVVIHGHMDGGQFVMSHAEIDRDSTKLNLEGDELHSVLLRGICSASGLTATTDDEVKVESVLLKDGWVIKPWECKTDWTASGTRNLRDERELSIKDGAKELLGLLKQLGLASATVDYSGSGDSGDAEYTEWVPVDGGTDEKAREYKQTVKRPTSRFDEAAGGWVHGTEDTDIDLEELLLDFTNRVVDHYHGGYEIDDGGAGSLHFDAIRGVVSLRHEDYYTESSCTDTELFSVDEEDDDASSGS